MARRQTPDQVFGDLVDRYLDRVYRYLRNLTRNEDTARDLCHETFLRLRRQVDRGRQPAEAYIFAAAHNTALSQWRSEKREHGKRDAWGREFAAEPPVGAPGDPLPGRMSPSSAVERRELRQALEAALECLSTEQRAVFLLSEVEGLKYEQVARVLNISPGTVASRKFNAIRALRGELERSGHALQ